MLAEAHAQAPDELKADFMRFFGVPDWTAIHMLRAAAWCASMMVQPESWVFRKMHPDWMWGVEHQLLAGVVDEVRALRWMLSRDGERGLNRPAPIPRPGVEGYRRPGELIHVPDFEAIDRELARPRVDIGRVR